MFPQDLARDGREATFYEELPPVKNESFQIPKNPIEPVSGFDDDFASGKSLKCISGWHKLMICRHQKLEKTEKSRTKRPRRT